MVGWSRRSSTTPPKCPISGCGCICHPKALTEEQKDKRKQIMAKHNREVRNIILSGVGIWIAFVIGLYFIGGRRTGYCYPTIMVDGRECRYIKQCTSTGACRSHVDCNFEGPARGENCGK